MEVESRHARHLMRQRGTGARELKNAQFGFTFALPPAVVAAFSTDVCDAEHEQDHSIKKPKGVQKRKTAVKTKRKAKCSTSRSKKAKETKDANIDQSAHLMLENKNIKITNPSVQPESEVVNHEVVPVTGKRKHGRPRKAVLESEGISVQESKRLETVEFKAEATSRNTRVKKAVQSDRAVAAVVTDDPVPEILPARKRVNAKKMDQTEGANSLGGESRFPNDPITESPPRKALKSRQKTSSTVAHPEPVKDNTGAQPTSSKHVQEEPSDTTGLESIRPRRSRPNASSIEVDTRQDGIEAVEPKQANKKRNARRKAATDSAQRSDTFFSKSRNNRMNISDVTNSSKDAHAPILQANAPAVKQREPLTNLSPNASPQLARPIKRPKREKGEKAARKCPILQGDWQKEDWFDAKIPSKLLGAQDTRFKFRM